MPALHDDEDEELKDALKHGGRVYVPMLHMDGALQDGQYLRIGMSFRDHVTADRSVNLKAINDAAYAKSRADINGWRGETGVADRAPADLTALQAMGDAAFAKSVEDLNAWRQ